MHKQSLLITSSPVKMTQNASLPRLATGPVLPQWQPVCYPETYPNEMRHGYQQVSLFSPGEDELLMRSDSFRVSKCRLCVKQGGREPADLVFLCLWAS